MLYWLLGTRKPQLGYLWCSPRSCLWPPSTQHLVLRSPDRPSLLLLYHSLEFLVPGVTSAVQGDGGCGRQGRVSRQELLPPLSSDTPPTSAPPRTREEVTTVFLQLLGL